MSNPFLLSFVLAVLLAPANAGPLAAQPCPIVDRGSPIDGVTTITVLEPPAACAGDPLFAGWRCMTVVSNANANGVVYEIDIRWNRVEQPVRGSFTWMIGGGSTESLRQVTLYAKEVQDSLDVVDEIRTIEVKFLALGTGTPPRNGFVNISSVYADVLEYLVAHGIAAGVIGHFGSSGGSMMGANAVAYHGLEQLLDGVVFGGGPFWSDLEAVCTDPSSPIFADAHLRATTDDWNWESFNGTTPCSLMSPEPSPPYTCRSTLGVEADADYPDLMVSVIIGTQDGFNPWMDHSATAYSQAITARRKTFDRPVAPHNVFNSLAGANQAKQRIREIVEMSGSAAVAPADAPAILAVSGVPNPFRPAAPIRFAVPRRGWAVLAIHDVQGRRLRTLVDREIEPGSHEAIWDGEDAEGRPAARGIYFVRLETRGAVLVRKLTLLR